MKEWVTVYRHNDREIQILSGAESGDPIGYRIQPKLSHHCDEEQCIACLYSTVADAVEAIDREV